MVRTYQTSKSNSETNGELLSRSPTAAANAVNIYTWPHDMFGKVVVQTKKFHRGFLSTDIFVFITSIRYPLQSSWCN